MGRDGLPETGTSRTVEVLGSWLHYREVGAGAPIVFLHGNPTSSYLWRNVLPVVAPYGRGLALDLIGMGGSGKPPLAYRLREHRDYLDAFIDALGLTEITFVMHDWGVALGLDYLTRHPERVRAVAFMEGHLHPIARWADYDEGARAMFSALRSEPDGRRMIIDENFFIEMVLPSGMAHTLTAEEWAAYRAPYLEPASREPLWRWVQEIPIEGSPADVDAIVQGYRAALAASAVPKLLLHGEPGAVIGAAEVAWCRETLTQPDGRERGRGHALPARGSAGGDRGGAGGVAGGAALRGPGTLPGASDTNRGWRTHERATSLVWLGSLRMCCLDARGKMQRMLTALIVIVVAVGFVNFVAFLIGSQRLGGDALNGYEQDGHFYVAGHGNTAEVSEAQWRRSRLQAFSVLGTFPLALLGLAYLLFRYIFPAQLYRGPRAALAAVVRDVRASGPPLAAVRCSGTLGGLELSGPLVGATVYPGGVVIVPLLMPPFAIGVGDIVAIEFRRNWTAPGCEIAHTSAQIAQPIRLRCA